MVGRSGSDDDDDAPVHGHRGGAQRQGAAAAAADTHERYVIHCGDDKLTRIGGASDDRQ